MCKWLPRHRSQGSYLEGLSFSHVVFRMQQLFIFAKELERGEKEEESHGDEPSEGFPHNGWLVSKHGDEKMRSLTVTLCLRSTTKKIITLIARLLP